MEGSDTVVSPIDGEIASIVDDDVPRFCAIGI